MQTSLSRSTLVLNADYLPMWIIGTKKALVHLYLGKAEVIKNYDDLYFNSPSTRIPAPSIIRLKKWVKVHYRDVPLTKRNIFLRDRFTCGYTGVKITKEEDLTVDHIIPTSKGGTHSWDNVVTAKKSINELKRDYVLGVDKEVSHLKTPKVGRPHALLMMSRRAKSYSEDWEHYLIIK
jgi:5-methylcytosine-specific restriction endonuclease McrA